MVDFYDQITYNSIIDELNVTYTGGNLIYLECPKKYKEFAWQCIEYLDIGHIDATIYIHTNKNLKCSHGLCWGDEEEVEISLSTTVNKSLWDTRATIAHELVHARQNLLGQMCNEYGEHGTTVWKGRAYNHFLNEDNQPWEREAEALEEEMMNLFYPGKKP